MERLSITHGMHVADAQGSDLGVVQVCGSEHVLLHKGLFGRKSLAIRLRDIADLEEGVIHLRSGAEVLSADQPDLKQGPRMGVLPFRRELLDQHA